MNENSNRPQAPQPHSPLFQLTVALAFVLMIGWLLIVGRELVLPIIVGIVSVYLLTASADWLARVPVVGTLGRSWRRFLVGFALLALVAGLIMLTTNNAQAIISALPEYEKNLTSLFGQTAKDLGFSSTRSLEENIGKLTANINFSGAITTLLQGLTGAGTFLVTVLLYAAFLLADWDEIPRKTHVALGNEQSAQNIFAIVSRINRRISGYLAAKTLTNIILGLASYLVLLAIGVEFAAFWAILIGLLNYIPYLGSIIGVVFPIALALGQFGSWTQALIVFVGLSIVQFIVGNIIEPKILGKSVNMSPFVFMIALAFWMTVWGLGGAILAVPLTSIIMIILAEFKQTRPVAIMMSGDGEV